MTPAERLIAAADLLDKRAGEATEGPWAVVRHHDQTEYAPIVEVRGAMLDRPHGKAWTTVAAGVDDELADSGELDEKDVFWFSQGDAAYIATMHPEVGKAVAVWLRGVGVAIKMDDPRLGAYPMEAEKNNALAIADLLLAGVA